MGYTLGEASKATGVSKPTLSRAIKSGKISAIKSENGVFTIEPVELHRVYPPKQSQQLQTGSLETIDNPNENGVLQARLNAALEQVEELREDRNAWRRQAEQLALSDQRPERPTSFWARLRGR